MANLDAAQLSAISRFFSSSVIREMARKGKSPLFTRLAKESRLVGGFSGADRVHCLFDAAFSILRVSRYRHEYIYKAALTHKILLGRHSLQSASMLTEFRVEDCKADLAILNGTATAYEIKSERDSLSRLERQVVSYRKVFAKVYVIAGENHVDGVFNTVPQDVGVLRLSDRHQISTLREAKECPSRTSPNAIFDSIRLNEAKRILDLLNVESPAVPNTELRSELASLFKRLDPTETHFRMVQVLKETRNLMPLAELVAKLPGSLQTAALSVPLRKSEHARLISAVNTRLDDAMAWA